MYVECLLLDSHPTIHHSNIGVRLRRETELSIYALGHQKKGSVPGSKGVDTQDAKGRFYNRTRWDHEGGHVWL